MILPNKWKVIPLEELAEVRSGVTLSQKEIQDGVELPYLRVANVQDGKIDLTEIKNVKVEKEKVERFLLKRGDILLTEGGDFDKLGRGAVWQGEIEPCLHQNHVFAVRTKESLLPEFFAALTRTHYGRTYFLSCAKRSTNLASINSSQLKRFPVLLPPLAEQKKIAEILSTWDEAISVVDKQLDNCRQQKKALMQQLLTGKKRLPGFSGEWKNVKLGDVAQVEKGTPLNGNNIALGPYPVIAGGKTVTTWHKEYTHENIITVSASGAYAGYVSIHTQKIWASDCSVIAPVKDELDLNFLFQNMLFKQEDIYKLQVGGAQPHVYPKDLIKFYMPLPSLREQQAISDILGLSDKQMCNLEKQVVLLKEEKKSLMQQLLTGKKRVAVEE